MAGRRASGNPVGGQSLVLAAIEHAAVGGQVVGQPARQEAQRAQWRQLGRTDLQQQHPWLAQPGQAGDIGLQQAQAAVGTLGRRWVPGRTHIARRNPRSAQRPLVPAG